MNWIKFEDAKSELIPGRVVLATFLLPESKMRILCTACVDNDCELFSVNGKHKISGKEDGINPDYIMFIEYPDQYLFSHFI